MEKLKYQAPMARDLSGAVVSGQGPLYLCNPFGMIASPEDCGSGAQAGGTCLPTGMVPGGAPASCISGTGPATGECLSGTGAANSQCLSGDADASNCGGGGYFS